ncbi:MAG TPA: ECF-type sigma factor [Balneolaceae bacterium]|nr:ECF-type sigma factor [Balneolaceae bacterium]
MNAQHDITARLEDARNGDSEALNIVFDKIYVNLREMAHQVLSKRRYNATMNTTSLVHEVYEKLIGTDDIEWEDRTHFFSVAAKAMRFVLIDYARAQSSQKRGGRQQDLSLDAVQMAAVERSNDLLALDEALELLAQHDKRLGNLVELKFFGGLTYKEISVLTGLSERTLKRDWERARTWIYSIMKES